MSTYFSNTDEARCALSSGDAFSLVTTDDTNVAFSNDGISITSADGLLAAAKLVISQTTFEGASINFKVKYATQ
jgi:hypothetical protein